MLRVYYRSCQTAPLMLTLRNFSSYACAKLGKAGLHSRVFSLSGLLGFEKNAAELLMRKSRAWARVSNASSCCMKESERVLYLDLDAGETQALKESNKLHSRLCHDHQTPDSLSLNEMVHDICPHVRSVNVQLE